MNDPCCRPPAADVLRRGAGLGQPGSRLAAAILALALLGTGASAADPGRRAFSEASRENGWAWPAGPRRLGEPAGRADLVARRSFLSIFGRDCLPGFALDEAGACVRHDDPRLACGRESSASGCVVLPPDPAPYGLGAALRLDY